MRKVKKINILSFVKFQVFLMGSVGLLLGIWYSFGGLIIDILVSTGWLSSTAMETPGLSEGTLLAFGALIGMPAIFMGFGLITGFMGGLMYQWYYKKVGGIQVALE